MSSRAQRRRARRRYRLLPPSLDAKGAVASSHNLLQMIGQSQRQRHQIHGRIGRAISRKDAAATDIKVGKSVYPRVGVYHTLLGIDMHACRAQMVIAPVESRQPAVA